MINRFLAFVQKNTEYLYENSLILQNLDLLILFAILAVFVLSTFVQSEFIGIFAFCAFALTVLKLLLKPNESLSCSKSEIFLIAYFMFVVISLCGSTLFSLSLKGFFKVTVYLGFYLSVVQYLKDNKDKALLIMFTIAGCVSVEVVQGLLQTVVRPEAISTWQDTSYLNPEEVINRVYGTLKPYNPNLFGGYLVAAIPSLFAVLGYFIYKNKKNYALITAIVAIVSFYVLFQTGCRGSYLGLFAVLLTFVCFSYGFFKDAYKKVYLSVIGGLSLLGFLFIMSVTSLRARVLSIFIMREDSSNSFRFNVYTSCLQMLKDNWLVGIGLGNNNFREIYGLYMKTGFDALSAYNIYLETAVESGIFALISVLCFLGFTIYYAYKFITRNEYSLDVILVTVALASIIGLMVHGCVDTVFFRPQIHFIFWFMAAVIRVFACEEYQFK